MSVLLQMSACELNTYSSMLDIFIYSFWGTKLTYAFRVYHSINVQYTCAFVFVCYLIAQIWYGFVCSWDGLPLYLTYLSWTTYLSRPKFVSRVVYNSLWQALHVHHTDGAAAESAINRPVGHKMTLLFSHNESRLRRSTCTERHLFFTQTSLF